MTMRIMVGDCESTGLISNRVRTLEKQPKITEYFGLISDEEGNELEAHHIMVNPGEKLSKEIVKITKITDEMLAEKPRFASIAPELKRIIESVDLLYFHNASFDRTILDFEFQRAGVKVDWPEVRCSVEGTEWILGRRMKQMELYEMLFGETFENSHRAEADVRALSRCIFELRKRGDL